MVATRDPSQSENNMFFLPSPLLLPTFQVLQPVKGVFSVSPCLRLLLTWRVRAGPPGLSDWLSDWLGRLETGSWSHWDQEVEFNCLARAHTVYDTHTHTQTETHTAVQTPVSRGLSAPPALHSFVRQTLTPRGSSFSYCTHTVTVAYVGEMSPSPIWWIDREHSTL